MDETLDLAAFWPEFEAEVRENLRRLEEGLMGLEDNPDALARVHELMRLAHTVKGAARLMSQARIATLAARLEDALRELREGQKPITPELKSTLLALVDDLAAALDAAGAGEGEQPATASNNGSNPSSEPVARASAAGPGDISPSSPAFAPARVDAQRLDNLTALGTVLHIQHMRLQDLSRRLTATVRALTEGNGHILAHRAPRPEAIRDLHALEDDIHRAVEDMELTLNSLETMLLDMRLVPFDVLAPVLRRVVRDAARNLGKRVNLVIEGGQVHVDRQLIGPLQDALIHLLRNAVDHGIASPESRQQMGKSPVGTIWVRASTKGNMMTIRVEDDGRGVNLERVRASAVERGFLLPSEAQRATDRELLRLLLRPGFTTREQVGTFSGQGVGLDAVATVVRRLGGDVDIESVPGKGTAVILRVPTNLALVDVLLVRVGSHSLGVPLAQIDAVLPRENAVFLTNGPRRMVRWQETPIPIISMPALMGLPEQDADHIIVLSSGTRKAAIEGITVQDQVTLALRPLPALLKSAPFVYGSSILGDSSVVFVVAVEPLVRFAHVEGPRQTSQERKAEGKRPPRVLVVDDGATTRDLLRSALTAAGYEVLTAGDGEEALRVLAREGAVDLVITDVQMPGVDGITLTRRLRSDPAWRDIPIIILTIQARPEDIRRGLEAGATAYLTKQDFEEGTLLETIEQVL